MYETLVGAGQIRLAATQPSSVLKIDREDLFDLLGQRPDLLQQIFAAIFDRRV
jgi:CRP-like cAMP-binding protein